MRRSVTPLILLVALLLPACATEQDDGSGKSAGQPSGEERRQTKPRKPASFNGCLKDAGFDVERRDGNLVRATPDDGLFVNINEFPSVREAREFDQQLEVPHHVHFGKRVAIGPPDHLEGVELCLRIDGPH